MQNRVPELGPNLIYSSSDSGYKVFDARYCDLTMALDLLHTLHASGIRLKLTRENARVEGSGMNKAVAPGRRIVLLLLNDSQNPVADSGRERLYESISMEFAVFIVYAFVILKQKPTATRILYGPSKRA